MHGHKTSLPLAAMVMGIQGQLAVLHASLGSNIANTETPLVDLAQRGADRSKELATLTDAQLRVYEAIRAANPTAPHKDVFARAKELDPEITVADLQRVAKERLATAQSDKQAMSAAEAKRERKRQRNLQLEARRAGAAHV